MASPIGGPAPADPRDALVNYLRHQRDVMASTLPGVRAKDVEAVHDMRVAARRIRLTLRTFRTTFDRARVEWLRTELHWLADVLGAVRDTDVMFARLSDAIAQEPDDSIIGPMAVRVRRRLMTSARAAHAELAIAVDSRRNHRLTDALVAFIDSQTRPITEPDLRRRAFKPLRKADRLLDTAGTDATALHEARRAYKRARYAVDVLIAIDGLPAQRLANRIADLQEILGTHQDAILTADLLRDYGMRAHSDGENAFSYGILYARQLQAAEDALDGLDRARRRASKATYL